jgi:hypothetical protein
MPIRKCEITQAAAVAEMSEARVAVMQDWHSLDWNAGGVPTSQVPSTTHMPPVSVMMAELTARGGVGPSNRVRWMDEPSIGLKAIPAPFQLKLVLWRGATLRMLENS